MNTLNLNTLKPYAIIILAEAVKETHLVAKEHYEFGEVKFFDDADECMSEYEAMVVNGVKAFVLNNHALMFEFIKHQKECLAIKLGINEIEAKGLN